MDYFLPENTHYLIFFIFFRGDVDLGPLFLLATPCAYLSRAGRNVYQSASCDLLAIIVPGQSDFKYGTTIWKITARGRRTLLVYEASMQPDFFIPPMIGRYLVQKKLKDELLVSFSRIECCASSRVSLSESVPGAESTYVQRPEVC